jgi:hypothetical protein
MRPPSACLALFLADSRRDLAGLDVDASRYADACECCPCGVAGVFDASVKK